MLIASTGSGSIIYFIIRKAMVSGMQIFFGTAGSGYYIDLKRVAGFHERSHKRTCSFLGD